jgi:hypothetical protein
MMDRKARDQMAAAIRSYMDDRIAAFEFDGALAEIMRATEDRTVVTTRQALWFCYDDLKDHRIVATKGQWDFFNRILLLLASEAEIELVKTSSRWHFRQAVAALFLAGFAFGVVRTGFGKPLFAYALFSGSASMLLAWFNSRHRKRTISATAHAITPFPSITSLLTIRRRVADFARKKYPKAISGRRIRHPLVDKIMWIPWMSIWLTFSPVVLFFQMLPDKETEARIKIPEPQGAGDAVSRA